MYTLSETLPREVWHVPPLPCVSSFPRSQNANFQNPRCENTPLIGRESPPPSVSLSLLLLSASATLGNTHLPLLYTLKGAGCVAKHRIWPINGSTLNRRAVSHLPWRTKLNSATFDIAHKNNKTKSVNTVILWAQSCHHWNAWVSWWVTSAGWFTCMQYSCYLWHWFLKFTKKFVKAVNSELLLNLSP